MLRVGAATMEEDVRLGVQVLVEGDKVDIEEFVGLLSMFLQLLVPAMMTLVSIHHGCIEARCKWTQFWSQFTIELPRVNIQSNKLTFAGTLLILRVAPVLMLILIGAFIYGLTK